MAILGRIWTDFQRLTVLLLLSLQYTTALTVQKRYSWYWIDFYEMGVV